LIQEIKPGETIASNLYRIANSQRYERGGYKTFSISGTAPEGTTYVVSLWCKKHERCESSGVTQY